MIYFIIPTVLAILFLIFWFGTYFGYRYVFYSRSKKGPNVGNSLSTEQFSLVHDERQRKMEELEALEAESVEAVSSDGLTLRGLFYPSEGSNKAVIVFHGFRSNIFSDGALISKICLENGFNVLLVHQRAQNKSDGKTITFGVRERLDCKTWVDQTVDRLGSDCSIVLMGVSMGASTVMMASDLDIPNVKGIFADCGFTSPKDILCAVIGRLGYPQELTYRFLRLCALIHGGFDPESASCEKSLKKSSIPITIVHGDNDRYVPCEMGKRCYEASASEKKRLMIVQGAGHTFSYYFQKEEYENAVLDMLKTVCE